MAAPAYPASLTVKSWNKAKGLIAIVTKVQTGVTDLLATAEKNFKAAPWDAIDPDKEAVFNTVGDAVRLGKGAVQQVLKQFADLHQKHFKALEDHFTFLSNELNKKAAEFDNQPKLKKFAPVLAKMAKDAHQFAYAVAWGTASDPLQKEVLKRVEQIKQREVRNLELFRLAVPGLRKCIDCCNKHLRKLPTPNAYFDDFAQNHRLPGTFIGTAIKADKARFEPLFKSYMDYADAHFLKVPAEKTDMKKRIEADNEIFEQALEKIENMG